MIEKIDSDEEDDDYEYYSDSEHAGRHYQFSLHYGRAEMEDDEESQGRSDWEEDSQNE